MVRQLVESGDAAETVSLDGRLVEFWQATATIAVRVTSASSRMTFIFFHDFDDVQNGAVQLTSKRVRNRGSHRKRVARINFSGSSTSDTFDVINIKEIIHI